jgi:hypothetical protein
MSTKGMAVTLDATPSDPGRSPENAESPVPQSATTEKAATATNARIRPGLELDECRKPFMTASSLLATVKYTCGER